MGRPSTRPSSRAWVSASIPVQVLEGHEERLPLALPEQEVLDGVEGALPALGGIERLPGGVLDRQVEQGQQGGQDRLEGPIQREKFAGDLLADLAVGLAIVDLEVGLEEADDGQVAASGDQESEPPATARGTSRGRTGPAHQPVRGGGRLRG